MIDDRPKKNIEPIKPEELTEQFDSLPAEAVEAINALILNNWNGSQAAVTEDIFEKRVSGRLLMPLETIRKKKLWQRTIQLFREVGWGVEDFGDNVVFRKK